MRISRGEIYFIKRGNQYQGNEIAKDRPGVIVSAEHLNAGERFVEVVYLTTQPKREMLEHVPILSSGRCSTALCEQINSVSIERLGNFCGRVSLSEMRDIDKALANSLGLGQELCGGGSEPHGENQEFVENTQCEEVVDITKIVAERDAYKEMYEKLLDRVMR